VVSRLLVLAVAFCLALGTHEAAAWDDYQIIVWQAQPAERLAALRRLGISAGALIGERDALPDAAVAARRVAPFAAAGLGCYLENIATDFYAPYHRWTPDHPVTWLFDQAREAYRRDPADPAAFRRVPGLSDPVWLDRVAARLAAHVRAFGPYRPLFYNLADEAGIADLAAAWDFDFSPASLAGLRAWLRNQYGTLAALNAEWGTAFADWDAVQPMTTDAARARADENFAAWADFKAWMDVAFAQAVRAGSNALHAADPAALAGLEGAQAPGWGGYDYSALAPAVDVMELYDHGNNMELARAFNPAIALLTTSFGADAAERHAIWRALLMGTRGLILWDEGDGLVGEDGSSGPRGRALAPTFAELRGGLGAQVMAARPQPDRVAILYSPASFRTRWLLDRRADGKPWTERGSAAEWDDDNAWRAAMGRAVRTLTEAGLQPRFLTDAMIAAGALREGGPRLLLLPQAIALSPAAAAEIGAFAGRGGAVAADAEPGQFDAHSRRLPAPLLSGLPWRRVDAFSRAELEPLWRAAGLAPAVRMVRPDGTPVEGVEVRLLHAGDVVLLGLQRERPVAGVEDFDLVLPVPRLVRDLRRPGPAEWRERWPVRLDGIEPVLLALSPEPLPSLVLTGPAELAAGETAELGVALAAPTPAGVDAVRLEVRDPRGEVLPERAATLLAGAAARTWRLRSMPGDPPGRWTVQATDRLGGGTAMLSFTLRP
jgi:hypothetical protein